MSTPVETRIEAVTVYTDRARVRRHGKIHLPAGQHELVVEDLPTNLLAESVRAAARATAPSRIVGTDVTRTFHTAPVETKPAQLQAEIERLQDQDESLKRRLEALTARKTFLQGLATSLGPELARGIAFGRSTVDAGAAASTFLGEQFAAVETDVQALEIERRQVGKELDAARSRLQSLNRRTPTERMTVTVLLLLEAEADLELNVTYQVTGARWEPLYDLRLSENNGITRLALSYMAQVTQNTGEPWETVALALSTAKPALSLQIPELSPWFLAAPVPRRMEMMRARGPAMGAVACAAPPAPAQATATLAEPEDFEEQGYAVPAFLQSQIEAASVEETGASVTFGVGGDSGIPDDGSPHKVSLGDWDLPVAIDYVTAPKLVQQAYRRAKVTNSSSAILLPGTAQIFEGEEYIGSTTLKTVAPGQEWEVFLGVDDRVKVERKLVEGSVDKKLLVDVRRMTYGYEIKVRNLKSGPEKVTVLDQLPVSRHEQVKIRRTDPKPAPTKETEMGEARWELQLAAGQETTVRFGFVIEAPRDLELTGLPPLKDA